MLEKIFEPKTFEKNFSFDFEASLRNPDAEPFVVLLPPPNITGSLHIGHALCYTLQDVLVRYKRLKGNDVVFQPGLDHAGIVTQLIVEKILYSRGISKASLTRETLLKEIWHWKEHSGGGILEQMKSLGISCDLSRLRFTMDEESKKAVVKLFVKLYRDGLIYRGKRIVNWDPSICSAISDLEVKEKEVDGHLWHIKYMIEGSDDFIVVATSRPETIFGDVAIAVNPKDKRYSNLVGKNALVPLINRPIPIITDEYADPDKGSGVVKITPAHDFNDFEVGRRHKLPIIDIFNEKAELNDNVPELFRQMDRFEARKAVVEFLQQKEAIVQVDNIKQVLPFGDRSGVVLEPRITNQWFLDAEQLAGPAIEAVKSGKIKFIPKHWENLYFEWLNNIRPWCISRQIWWGHRIPAWYGPDKQVFVAETFEEAEEQAIKFYGKTRVTLTQDPDILDTWFSSGMWPFITMGWPKDNPDLKKYYPTTTIVTGFDIIFFWVSRMIMLGLYTMNEVPFRNVYIHSLVRDAKGQKMSKSKGNVVDPLTLCEKYGADAVRYTLTSMASPGRDMKITEKNFETGRNFLTKLWNAIRFSEMNGCTYNEEFKISDVKNPISKWMIYEVKKMIELVECDFENYRFDEAAKHISQTVWDSFCDWYIELIKPILQQTTIDETDKNGYNLKYTILKKDIRDTTAWIILQFIRVMYPITPFISKKLAGELGALDITWPDLHEINADFSSDVKKIELIKEIISSIRTMKQCLKISPSDKLNVRIESQKYVIDLITEFELIIEKMASVKIVTETSKNVVPIIVDGAIIHLELSGEIDSQKEQERLRAEIQKLEKIKRDAVKRLSNKDFLENASEEVILEHNERVAILSDKIKKIEYVIDSLSVL